MYTLPCGMDLEMLYKLGIMVWTRTNGHGIVSVLLNHTHTRGPSVARMRDFFEWHNALIVGFLLFNFCLPVDVVVVVGVGVQVGRDQQWQEEHDCMGQQHHREIWISFLKRIGFPP